MQYCWITKRELAFMTVDILITCASKIFVDNIMGETLHDYHTFVSIGGRPICNLHFTDNIDLIAGINRKVQDLTANIANADGMENITNKGKADIYMTEYNSKR